MFQLMRDSRKGGAFGQLYKIMVKTGRIGNEQKHDYTPKDIKGK